MCVKFVISLKGVNTSCSDSDIDGFIVITATCQTIWTSIRWISSCQGTCVS